MSREFKVAALCTALVWIGIFAWLGSSQDRLGAGYSVSGRQADYYNRLVEGFERGHLSLDVEVDPNLLSPDARVRRRAGFLLDAALFNGRYYLYYGVVPALLTLYPFYAITGNEMSLSVAEFIFWVVGFLAAIALLFELGSHLGENWGAMSAVVGVSLVAAAPGTAWLVRRASYHTLPEIAGYACLSVFSLAALRAFRPRPSTLSLGIATLAASLAVGCRPNLIFVLPIFSCGLVACVQRERLLRSLAIAAAPAVTVGAFLAWYNRARFGSILDFGFSHGIGVSFDSGHPFWSWSFLPANFSWYLLTPPSLVFWFPFVFGIEGRSPPPGYSDAEEMSGFLAVMLVALVIAVGYGLSRGDKSKKRLPRTWVACLAVWGILEGLFVLGLGFRADRYGTDFLTPVALLAALFGLVTWGRHFRFCVIYRSMLVLAVFTASLHTVFASLDSMHYSRPKTFDALNSFLSPAEATAEWLGADKAGPVRLGIIFHKPESANIINLYSTGVGNYRDALNATVLSNGYASFQILHEGYGGPTTGLIPVDWNKPYQIELSMGSLYPPLGDPYFKGWGKDQANRAKVVGYLSLGGHVLIDRYMEFFDGSPGIRRVSSSPGAAQVANVEVLDEVPDAIKRPIPSPPSLYRFKVSFKGIKTFGPTPLLCSGKTGDGDLLYLDPLPSGRYRLALDEWGFGTLSGHPFDIDLTKSSEIEIIAGPALSSDARLSPAGVNASQLENLRDRLLVWWNGERVADFTLTRHLQSFTHLLVGRNDPGFTSADAEFAGAIQQEPLGEGAMRQLVDRALKEQSPKR